MVEYYIYHSVPCFSHLKIHHADHSILVFNACLLLFLFINLFIYYYYYFLIYLFYRFIFLAALGLRCCTRAFSSCGERGLLFIAVDSLVAEYGL